MMLYMLPAVTSYAVDFFVKEDAVAGSSQNFATIPIMFVVGLIIAGIVICFLRKSKKKGKKVKAKKVKKKKKR